MVKLYTHQKEHLLQQHSDCVVESDLEPLPRLHDQLFQRKGPVCPWDDVVMSQALEQRTNILEMVGAHVNSRNLFKLKQKVRVSDM